MLYESGNRTPSGVIAQTAGALAVFGGLINFIGGAVLLVAFVNNPAGFDNSLALFTILGTALMAYALIFGGLQLWRQDETGRYTVIVATGVAIVIGLVGLAFSLTDYEFGLGVFWWSPDAYPRFSSPAFGLVGQVTALVHEDLLVSAIDLVLPLIILVLTVAKYSARWTATRPVRRARRY